ncbi:pyridine nucleotide-disulfide oxidoreductase domain 1, variant 2 [Capsaspora owczarzaki ATCC 30864]|uniref:Pyridine nucleotide-disulfide oxidoreductase domain-containing protein 1 n=1 Tax=Capsaspora owczarzaki (strain ATCC 30864) TaxID=595528 RepID=A0A0D2VZC7_CAPO3|nr:pyridine nucleotide-disulfide oxidoreductase domain 1, variant 1 [Capsaspora owczarzaki ATCC 30864]KJE97178.1 pyridine nucleotide-disulfide oxidoreductase domain 1, variant 2 [Capsaspora owczarzaki ATCC 30864]
MQDLQARLGSARRVVVVGNGGIALELVHEVQFCDVVWAVRDEHIGTSFFDAGAATFFMSDVKLESAGMSENESTATLRHGLPEEPEETENGVAIFTPHTLQQRAAKAALASARAGVSDIPSSQAPPEPNQTAPAMEVYSGAALGPRWQDQARLHPIGERIDTPRRVVELSTSVSAVLSPAEFVAYRQQHPAIVHNDTDILDWPAIVVLSNNRVYGCDVVVSATGVVPCADFIGPEILRASDGGIAVNDQMQTNLPDVFAAGDVCTVQWPTSSHWFQLRLWTQARQMGAYAARCIQAAAKHELALLDFCFEAFAHVTRFFGFKVVLLGLYNAQGLAVGDYEVLLRVTRGHEYIKLVLANGCVQGAVLIGETDLEETFENLILNQLDVSAFKDMLLDPDVDVEDYFD